jgi:hypothetical protein
MAKFGPRLKTKPSMPSFKPKLKLPPMPRKRMMKSENRGGHLVIPRRQPLRPRKKLVL